MQVKINKYWSSYELIDCGNANKIERFGDKVLIRPERSAVGKPAYSENQWHDLANAIFIEETKNEGKWKFLKDNFESWVVKFPSNDKDISLKLELTNFKHIGVFPEQSINWNYISKVAEKYTEPNMLNLFGYTGVASCVAAVNNYNVVHIEALKQLVAWGKNNAQENDISNVKWYIDDVTRFISREVRRNNQYSAVILDPPTIGRGPKGERWKFERDINNLCSDIDKIVKPKGYVIMSMYANSMNKKFAHKLILQNFKDYKINFCDELIGVATSGEKMSHGFLIRLIKR